MTHPRFEEPRLHELRDACQNLSGALGVDLVGCWNAHELVVDGYVLVQKAAAVLAGAGSENGDDLSAD